jgi:hypothetical protein
MQIRYFKTDGYPFKFTPVQGWDKYVPLVQKILDLGEVESVRLKSEDGRTVNREYINDPPPVLDLQPNDTFTMNGLRYSITQVNTYTVNFVLAGGGKVQEAYLSTIFQNGSDFKRTITIDVPVKEGE